MSLYTPLPTCKHCGDMIPDEICPECEVALRDLQQCVECHAEVAHGVIDNKTVHLCGNDHGWKEDDAPYFPSY